MSRDPELRTAGPLRVAGFTTRTNNARERTEEGSIGALWAKYVAWAGENTLGAAPVGVYCDYETDHNGDYTLLVGHPIGDDDAPTGLTVVEVPRADYLVFRGEGGIPACVISAWQRVWAYFDDTAPHVRAYSIDFEQYDEGCSVDVHVSVRPR